MKIRSNPPRIPMFGEQRVVKRFLFFPTSLEKEGGIRETRWFEFAEIIQSFKGSDFPILDSRWKNLCWNN
jgi:hypothetical protein